jgi:V8-like Glu-specific endopeptidase
MVKPPLPLLVALLGICLPYLFTPTATAQEVSAKLLGGAFAAQSAGKRIAYIETSTLSCTGTLVAERLVLTAGHCVPSSIPASDYTVYVGDSIFSAEGIIPHPDYDDTLPDDEAAPNDLGMIVLASPVENFAPIPVLTGHRLLRNERYYLAGYGANEETWDTTRSWEENFKVGATRLKSKDGSLLWGTHTSLGTSICAGDSGGPATLMYGTHLLLVGVASIGVNDLDRGECLLTEDGSFAHVDLQSSSSQAFLDYFPDIQVISHGIATIAGASDTATTTLRKAMKGGSLSRLKQTIRAQRAELSIAARYAAGERATLLQGALSALKAASNARSLAAARGKIRIVITKTSELSALGLS